MHAAGLTVVSAFLRPALLWRAALDRLAHIH
jgi:hypothetical protein